MINEKFYDIKGEKPNWIEVKPVTPDRIESLSANKMTDERRNLLKTVNIFK
jgi:hypothetical protein